MVIESIVILVALLVGMLLGAAVAEKLGVPQRLRFPFETGAILALLGVLAEHSFLSWGSTFLVSGGYLVVAILLVLYLGWTEKRTLAGKNGDVAKWTMELQNDGDKLFLIAFNELSRSDAMEVGVIAETRGEFRDLMVKRFEEQADEQIPADFAQ